VESSLAFQEVSIGNASAPLQIEIFQDTDCGMCRFAFKEMVPQIVEGYVKAGKARITFKEYPLVVNTDAVNRVKALWCSANQNKYGPLLAELYGWDEKAGGHLILEQVAASTGIDMVEFRRCVASSRANDFVNQSIREGQSRGVDGTPSIYVNGNLVGGARSFDEMKSLLDDILANRSVSHD
jgi:protein-disulfide isomerase